MTQETSWKCFGIAIAAVIAICVIVVVTALMVTRPWFASSKKKDSFHEVTQSSTFSVPTSQNTTDVTPSGTSEGTSTSQSPVYVTSSLTTEGTSTTSSSMLDTQMLGIA